jgi:hypothetical protein
VSRQPLGLVLILFSSIKDVILLLIQATGIVPIKEKILNLTAVFINPQAGKCHSDLWLCELLKKQRPENRFSSRFST